MASCSCSTVPPANRSTRSRSARCRRMRSTSPPRRSRFRWAPTTCSATARAGATRWRRPSCSVAAASPRRISAATTSLRRARRYPLVRVTPIAYSPDTRYLYAQGTAHVGRARRISRDPWFRGGARSYTNLPSSVRHLWRHRHADQQAGLDARDGIAAARHERAAGHGRRALSSAPAGTARFGGTMRGAAAPCGNSRPAFRVHAGRR